MNSLFVVLLLILIVVIGYLIYNANNYKIVKQTDEIGRAHV